MLVASSSASSKAPTLGPPSFVVGATEDHALWQEDGGAAVYDQMQLYGLGAIRMSVDYEPSEPTKVQQEDALRRAIAPALERDVRVLLSIAPGHSTDVTGVPGGVQKFAAYTALVARAFPDVTDFIIGNEPNLGRFWSPTFKPNGAIASAVTYEAALAASYDALKAVNPNIDVIGLAVSPRGDDRPGSARNTVSPVRFINAVGAAYRASGRSLPIMDNVALHPYPNVNTDAPEKGYSWPNAGVPNLDRAQQAFWDAFNGTAQPTFKETGGGLADGRLRRLRQVDPRRGGLADEHAERRRLQRPGERARRGRGDAGALPLFGRAPLRLRPTRRGPALLPLGRRDRPRSLPERRDPRRRHRKARRRRRERRGRRAAAPAPTSRGGTRRRSTVRRSISCRRPATSSSSRRTKTRRSRRREEEGSNAKPLRVDGKVKAYLGTGVKFPGIKLADLAAYKFTVKVAAALNPARTATLTP